MKFNDLVNSISSTHGVPRDKARKIIKDVFGHIKETVSVEDQILIPEFGRFSSVRRKSRMGTNLVTNERVIIPSRTVVKFAPATTFKKSVDSE